MELVANIQYIRDASFGGPWTRFMVVIGLPERSKFTSMFTPAGKSPDVTHLNLDLSGNPITTINLVHGPPNLASLT